jgi:hypothetical protein
MRSFPFVADPPSTLPVVLAPRLYGAYAHDTEFGYAAGAQNFQGVLVTKTPLAGGAPIILVDEPLENPSVGGMADAGDALLLQVRWNPEPTYDGEVFTRVWRIPKDGSPRSEVRLDVTWNDPLGWTHWLAWNGAEILGAIEVQNYVVTARVPASGTPAATYLKLRSGVVTRRGDEILTAQTLMQPPSPAPAGYRLLVASSKGDPAGAVVACGGARTALAEVQPVGLAANDGGIYVAYRDDDDLVIARVAQ